MNHTISIEKGREGYHLNGERWVCSCGSKGIWYGWGAHRELAKEHLRKFAPCTSKAHFGNKARWEFCPKCGVAL